MTIVPFTQCCSILEVSAKTLREWLKRESMSLHQSPTDARVKCLTSEQVHLLADLHGRILRASSAKDDHKPSETTSQMTPPSLEHSDMREQLTRLEVQVTSQQAQIAQLALQLLQERDQRIEQRLLTLEAFLIPKPGPVFQPPTPSVSSPQKTDREMLPPTKRGQPIPLIEYSASGSYVLICPKEGELPITPDTPEWFAWLASLSSFRFVGPSGRLSARRGRYPRSHRSWYAQRTIHQHSYSKYIGTSKHVTIARLEQIAAILQSYVS